MEDESLETRLARLDADIVAANAKYMDATWHFRADEAAEHLREMDRLVDLRIRMRISPLTATP